MTDPTTPPTAENAVDVEELAHWARILDHDGYHASARLIRAAACELIASRRDKERLDFIERYDAALNCNFTEPAWSIYPDVVYRPDMEFHARTAREAIDAALDAIRTERTRSDNA